MKKIFKKLYAGFRGALVLGVGVFIGAAALDSFGPTAIGWGTCALSIGAGLVYGRKVYRIFAHNDFVSTLSAFGSSPSLTHFTDEEQTPLNDIVNQVNNSSLTGRVYIYGNQLGGYQQLVACNYLEEEDRFMLNFANELVIGIESPQVSYLNSSFLKIILADLVWVQTAEGKDCYELRGGDVLELTHDKENPIVRPLVSYDGALFILLNEGVLKS